MGHMANTEHSTGRSSDIKRLILKQQRTHTYDFKGKKGNGVSNVKAQYMT